MSLGPAKIGDASDQPNGYPTNISLPKIGECWGLFHKPLSFSGWWLNVSTPLKHMLVKLGIFFQVGTADPQPNGYRTLGTSNPYLPKTLLKMIFFALCQRWDM